jgi:CHAD domain-containing protein
VRDRGIAGHRNQRCATQLPLVPGAPSAYRRVVVSAHLEVERKFDVDPSFTALSPPDLTALTDVASADEPVVHVLEATYFDTADLRLFSGRVTLRRRTGGPDAGWHLKLPAGAGARRELHHKLGRSVTTPPKSLLVPVTGLLRGASVAPIATLRTRRVVTALRDSHGRVLAELADDTVTATVLATGTDEPLEAQTWREIEVELVDGEEPLLAAVGEQLVRSGAAPSPRASKLGRAIASRVEAGDAPVEPREDGGPRAADVVLAAVRDQVTALQTADVALRLDQPDAVHQVRVACRRLRSIFSSFRRVLDRAATDPLRDELSWVAGELSTARDDEVALSHLRELVAAEPVEQVLGPVAARLQQAQLRTAQAGRERALETLSGPRYLRLLDALHGLLADPRLGDRADRRAHPVLRAAVRKAARRLDTRLERVDATDGPEKDEAVHEVRKAGKRLRYTAEVARADLGRPAKKLVKVSKKVQQALGDRQDTVVTREQCRRLAIAADAAGENSYTYGRLQALEEARANQAWGTFEALEPRLHAALEAVAQKH